MNVFPVNIPDLYLYGFENLAKLKLEEYNSLPYRMKQYYNKNDVKVFFAKRPIVNKTKDKNGNEFQVI